MLIRTHEEPNSIPNGEIGEDGLTTTAIPAGRP